MAKTNRARSLTPDAPTPTFRIVLRPERTTPKGRLAPPAYLHRVDYPPLLSGRPAMAVSVREPSQALRFGDEEGALIGLRLVRSLGFESASIEAVE